LLSFRVVSRESFAIWQIPHEIEGLVLIEDFSRGYRGRMGLEHRHHHDELECHLVARGRGAFLVGEQRIDAEVGTLLFIAPRNDHTLLEASRDFCRWMALFRKRLVRRVLPASETRKFFSADAPSSLERKVPRHAARTLAHGFAETRAQYGEAAPLYNAAVAYLLARAWKALQAAETKPVSSTLHPAVAEAVRRLQSAGPELSRAELARRCAISEWHLSKLFSLQVGMTLLQFRNRSRLDRFFELYGDGSRTKMAHAALDAGFGSYPQFHRVFRALTGYAPAEYFRERAR
jgi:AraC-like DNA-binding protein